MAEPIGKLLSQIRESRSLSLEQAARATHIRVRYLQALESGDFDALPSQVQFKGFLRAYAEYLGLDAQQVLAATQQQDQEVVPEEAPGEPQPETAAQPEENPPPAPQAVTAMPAQESAPPGLDAFQEIGKRLSQRRELLGLSLEDVERHTHLRARYLKALETGSLQGLPSPVQGRGMLKNYASFLGMDPEPLLLEFAEGLQRRLAVEHPDTSPDREAPRPSEIHPPGLLRRLFTAEMLFVVLFVSFLSVFIIWGAIRIFSLRTNQQPTPTAPSISEVLLAAPSSTITPTPAPPTATPPALPGVEQTSTAPEFTPLPGETGVRVYVTVRQRAWMRVLVDGELEFEGRVLPGSAYQYAGDSSVEILTGNAAAVQIFFNQQDLGLMGLFGQVANRIYTREGVLTPTPTITPTPSATPQPSATPSS
jgi:cytoskeleton protein RodZ